MLSHEKTSHPLSYIIHKNVDQSVLSCCAQFFICLSVDTIGIIHKVVVAPDNKGSFWFSIAICFYLS